MSFLAHRVLTSRHLLVTVLAVALVEPVANGQESEIPNPEQREMMLPPPPPTGRPRFHPDDSWPSRGDRQRRPRQGDMDTDFDMRPPKTGGDSLDVVERFLEMSPERLAMIRTLIERLEQMTPEEREAMQIRIASYRAMTRERRAHMMEEFQQVPVPDRLLLRMYWRSLPREVAEAEREKLHSMPREDRDAYRNELLAKARESGISIKPPSPPPNIDIPPPPELLPPPFPEHMMPLPRPAASAEAN